MMTRSGNSGISSPIAILAFICIAAHIIGPLKCATICETDTDCTPQYLSIPNNYRAICFNGTCSCPPDHVSSYWGALEFCLSPILNSSRPCSDSLDCEDAERCLQNSTCGKCSMGAFSTTTDVCEGPFQDGTCYHELDGSVVDWEPMRFQKACQGEGLHCDIRGSNKCICDESDYYDKNLNKCRPRPGLGEDCRDSKLCKEDPDSIGFTKFDKNNTCICVGIFNPVTKYCVQIPRGRCERLDHCSDNAKCDEDQCNCNPGYVDSRGGECLRFMFGSGCVSIPDFETQRALDYQGLKCINGAYRCASPMEEYYDVGEDMDGHWWWQRRHICVTEVGATCTGNEDTRCTDGASCVDVDGRLTCKCDQGYSPTPDNKCLKHVEFGGKCIDNCNNFDGLVCMNKTCQCPDALIQYDLKVKKCLSPEGHVCGTRSVGVPVKIECQAGLKCDFSSGPIHVGLTCLNDTIGG